MPTVLASKDRTDVDTLTDNGPDCAWIGNPALFAIVQWIQLIIAALLRMLEFYLGGVIVQFRDYKTRIEALEATALPYTKLDTAAAATSSSSAPSSAPVRSGCTRCKRCHAIGHDEPHCRTKDPVTIKKRVNNNQKARKEKERQQVRQPAPPLPPYPMFYQQPYLGAVPPPTLPSDHSAFTALAADAKELRRRKVQSARDKKKKGQISSDRNA